MGELSICTGATPMFPRQVAEKVFSLSAHEKSPALSVSMILDEDGALWDCKIRSSLLSVKRISYSNLDALLEQSLDQLPQELADLVQVFVITYAIVFSCIGEEGYEIRKPLIPH